MPKMSMKKFFSAPKPSRTSKKNRSKQMQYDEYVQQIRDSETDDVAELELDPTEVVRSVKVSLRRAAARVGMTLDVWDANGFVYFRKGTGIGARNTAPRTKTAAEVMRSQLPISFEEDGEEVDATS